MIPGEEEHLKCLPLQGNIDTNADPTSPGRCLKPYTRTRPPFGNHKPGQRQTYEPQFDISTYLGPLPAPFLGVDLRLPCLVGGRYWCLLLLLTGGF